MTIEIQYLEPLPRPPLHKRIWHDGTFLVQATFWWVFVRPIDEAIEKMRRRENDKS